MRACKCDRCGKYYEYYTGRIRFPLTEKANAIYLIDRDLEETCYYLKSYDLCSDCMQELEIFLSEYKK